MEDNKKEITQYVQREGRVAKIEKEKTEEKKIENFEDYEKLGYPKEKPIPVYLQDNGDVVLFDLKRFIEYKEQDLLLKFLPIGLISKFVDNVSEKFNITFLDNYASRLFDEWEDYKYLNPKEQFEFDNKKKKKEMMYGLGALGALALMIIFSIVPGYKVSSAKSYMDAGQFQEAYTIYDSVSKLSDVESFYKQYSFAMGNLEAKNFKQAKEELLKLEGFKTKSIDLNDAMNEIFYQEAQYFMENKSYEKAASNLRKTYNYKDSQTLFLEASYLSLEQLFKENKYQEAMTTLSLVGNYKDAQQKGRELVEDIYQKALTFYNSGNYAKAEELFYFISQNDYKDSKTMIYQSQYNLGLEFYKKSEYKKALEKFEKIPWFKDSSAMVDNMNYQMGKSLYTSDKIKAYDYFVKSISYKDSLSYLLKPDMVLFGNFKIDTYDGSVVTDLSLNFDLDNLFSSNNEDSSYLNGIIFDSKYEYVNGSYKNKTSVLTPKAIDVNTVELTVVNGSQTHVLTLVRNTPLSSLSRSDNYSSVKNSIFNIIDKKINK